MSEILAIPAFETNYIPAQDRVTCRLVIYMSGGKALFYDLPENPKKEDTLKALKHLANELEKLI